VQARAALVAAGIPLDSLTDEVVEATLQVVSVIEVEPTLMDDFMAKHPEFRHLLDHDEPHLLH
jgi:hypothetical protein